MLRFVLGLGLTVSPLMIVACESSDDGTDDVLREQLFAAQVELADAIDDVDAITDADDVISAEAIPGTDDVEYEIITVEGEDMIVRLIDGRTRRIVDEVRERADDRSRGDRDRLRQRRQRLADRVRHERDRRPDHRAARARLAGDDLESDWLDRDGRRDRANERL